MTEATWALVAASGLLSVFAGWYAYETHRVIHRMDLERENQSRSWLAFQVVPWRASLLKIRVENLGPGPAVEIDGKVEAVWDNGNYSFPWSYALLAPGKYEEFPFPGPSDTPRAARFRLENIRAHVKEVRATLNWRSASGHDYSLDKRIAIGQLTEDWVSSEMLATEDHPERLVPRIAKALEDIADHLRGHGA